MLTQEQNELLCRVEGSAPMGGIMRSHWLPVCMSEEVTEKDGAPVKSRLVGEDLVVFRLAPDGVRERTVPARIKAVRSSPTWSVRWLRAR